MLIGWEMGSAVAAEYHACVGVSSWFPISWQIVTLYVHYSLTVVQ